MPHCNLNTIESACHRLQVIGFLHVLWFPPSTKLSRYNYNVVESVCDLRHVGGFLLVLWFPPPIKLSRYNCSVVEVFVTCGFLLVLMFPPLPIKLSRYTKKVTNVFESVCDLRQVGGFLLVFWFLNLQSCHDITVMLLKVFVTLT